MAIDAGENRRTHTRVKKFLGPHVDLNYQEHGEVHQTRVRILDTSEAGLGVSSLQPIAPGTRIHYTIPDSGAEQRGKITRCHKSPSGDFRIGIRYESAFDADQESAASPASGVDYYEILQVNPKADPDTIHRFYRVLAQRYHPDNAETGNAQTFRLLMEAYNTLTDPEKRAAYDVRLQTARRQTFKVFEAPDKCTGAAGEKQKRRALLSALYVKRMRDSNNPGLSVTELEQLLDIPKEHLEFAIWYLKESGLLVRADNNRLTITIRGVDTAEALGDPTAQVITREDRLLESA